MPFRIPSHRYPCVLTYAASAAPLKYHDDGNLVDVVPSSHSEYHQLVPWGLCWGMSAYISRTLRVHWGISYNIGVSQKALHASVVLVTIGDAAYGRNHCNQTKKDHPLL